MIIMQNPGLPKNPKDYKNEVLELEKRKNLRLRPTYGKNTSRNG
jgi:hypothetical protein